MPEDPTEKKWSVYVALGIAGTIAMTDLVANGSLDASNQIVIAFLAFAGLRQAVKSFAKR